MTFSSSFVSSIKWADLFAAWANTSLSHDKIQGTVLGAVIWSLISFQPWPLGFICLHLYSCQNGGFPRCLSSCLQVFVLFLMNPSGFLSQLALEAFLHPWVWIGVPSVGTPIMYVGCWLCITCMFVISSFLVCLPCYTERFLEGRSSVRYFIFPDVTVARVIIPNIYRSLILCYLLSISYLWPQSELSALKKELVLLYGTHGKIEAQRSYIAYCGILSSKEVGWGSAPSCLALKYMQVSLEAVWSDAKWMDVSISLRGETAMNSVLKTFMIWLDMKPENT